ncbi:MULTISPECIES: ABC transporter ATP-binding protein [unclassified Mesorhizobium]|uniref:ABC transporter ATP-binding protein n=1 Tax=unclassified Mesorhizobium TaxID=325217 RepID=UPI0011271219|nr:MULTISPECIES: ABC transporter ATP-binding protein [unclassified Mesorhizobium]MBZ9739790.1 ABC transporter ATP-binding protein [Mesorhizobium sp. CO1-1-4]MBZ9804946.1 ABC transporter ATP-binding protein [Mesorhizobium sp. ES1-6]TPL88691.1 ABC transporter ATP-binding protein [Mesorhizobium sp. B2-3-12]
MIGQSLSLQSLSKHFGRAAAVDNVSFDIAAGEFVSVLGPSGSGKSTLLTMIAGFEPPSAGRIAIGGYDITGVAPNRRNIGMVFQKYALFPHMTVLQNVAFPLRMRGLAREAIKDRVKQMMELVQLVGFDERYPSQLSGGQQQRVAVARALVGEPPVLLMDEPLGALDKNLREAMQLEIKRIQTKLGATVVYVTHDQDEAMTMSDRVAVMAGGTLVQVGAPSDIYHRPRSAFVAQFVGKMNFIDGECQHDDADTCHIRVSTSLTLAVPSPALHGADRLRRGRAVRLAVRPESLSFAKTDGALALPGTVEAEIFVGPFRLYLLRLATFGQPVVQAQLATSTHVGPFARDERVTLYAARDAFHVFAAPEA